MRAGITIKGSRGPYLVDSGSLSTDRLGLSTITARFWAATPSLLLAYGLPGSSHPTYPFLTAETRSPSQGPGGTAYLDVSYAGIEGATPNPLYEVDSSLTDFPIEKHPNFNLFGGTKASPAPGAVFNDDGTFKNFTPTAPDYLRGVTSFTMPIAMVRETKVDRLGFPRTLGTISPPPGSYSSIAPGQNWLITGSNSQKRGNAYIVTTEWKSSGPIRWSNSLFS